MEMLNNNNNNFNNADLGNANVDLQQDNEPSPVSYDRNSWLGRAIEWTAARFTSIINPNLQQNNEREENIADAHNNLVITAAMINNIRFDEITNIRDENAQAELDAVINAEAVANNHLDIVQYIIANVRNNPNLQGENGLTLLDCAAIGPSDDNAQNDIVRRLMNNNINENVNLQDENNQTPLQRAAMLSNPNPGLERNSMSSRVSRERDNSASNSSSFNI